MRTDAIRWSKVIVILAIATLGVACGGAGGDSFDEELERCNDRCREINQDMDGRVCLGCFPRAASLPPVYAAEETDRPESRFALDGDERLLFEDALFAGGPVDLRLEDDSSGAMQLLAEATSGPREP